MNPAVLEPDEAYARQALASMTYEGRTAYAGLSDDELLEMLRADYWSNIDSELGDFDAVGLGLAADDTARARGPGQSR